MSTLAIAREIIRCHQCKLVQFMNIKRDCRRCKASLVFALALPPKPKLVIAPRPLGVTTGELIKRMRKQRGLSQKELAAKMGSTRTYISKVENGRCSPMQPSLMRIAAALDCDFLELLAERRRNLADVDDPRLVEFMKALFDDVQKLTHDQLWAVCKEARRLMVQQKLPSITYDSACTELEKGL